MRASREVASSGKGGRGILAEDISKLILARPRFSRAGQDDPDGLGRSLVI
jgi:hypothetical protein